jgi:hypothetical protein
MANTSATGGYLQPTNTGPLDDQALDIFIQNWLVGLAGITSSLIRPSWQPEPPNLPPATTTWVGFGITITDTDSYPAEVHQAAGNGHTELRRHETLEVLVSCYGPNARSLARLIRDNAQIPQNLEVLTSNGYGLIDADRLPVVPELVKETWLMRVDLKINLRRQVVRDYDVLNLLEGVGQIDNEQSIEPF